MFQHWLPFRWNSASFSNAFFFKMEAHISNYQHLSFWKKLSFPNLGKWIESNCYFSYCTLNYHSNSLWVRFILHSFEPFTCRKISILPVFSLWFCRTKKHTNSRSSFWISLPFSFDVCCCCWCLWAFFAHSTWVSRHFEGASKKHTSTGAWEMMSWNDNNILGEEDLSSDSGSAKY